MNTSNFVHAFELVKTRRSRLARSKLTLQFSIWVFGAACVILAIVAVATLPFYLLIISGLPSADRMEELMNPITGEMLQPTLLYDQNGETLLLTLAPDGIERHFVEARDVPWLAKAYVASNQPRFWQESEQDWIDLVLPPKTIAEQLVSRILLPSEPESWVGNLRINLLAFDVLEKYGREQVLTWALNSTDFGHWAFGVESAAQLYFGKSASELNLAESALLVAVAQAPALNPIDNPELTIRFQRLVLTSLWEQGLISEAELTEAVSQLLVFAQPRLPTSLAPDFTTLVTEQLENQLGHRRLIGGNLVVTATLDYSLQQQVNLLLDQNSVDTSALILDPVNDRIQAAVGEVSTPHDPQDIFSPFVYLSGFSYGLSPSGLVWDISKPGLTSGVGPTTFRMALSNQYANVETNLLNDPAIQRTVNMLMQAVGIPSLQGQDLNLLEAGRAFEIFSQNGLFSSTRPSISNTVLFATDQKGQVVLDNTRTQWQSIVSPEITYLVTDVLREKAAQVANLAATINRPVAVFNDPAHHWWLAYSPQRVIVLWTEKSPIDSAIAASIFQAAHQGLGIKNWDIPAGLISEIVCVPSGQIPDEDCPETRREWFLRGNEPTETDSLYQRLAVNSLNEKLATVFTPEEFVQERLYLMVPPDAEAWAEDAGIPLPPRDYDPIPEMLNDPTHAQIAEPLPFTAVSGLVEIRIESAENPIAYDIQVGQGLRPTEWLQIAKGRGLPSNVIVAHWDTIGLNGIWSIQLQVWDANGKVSRAYTLVTIGENDK